MRSRPVRDHQAVGVGVVERRAFPRRVYLGIIRAQGCRCAMCGERPASMRDVQFDHIVGLWIGGEDVPENLRMLCVACHKIETKREAKERAKVNRLARQRRGLSKKSKLSRMPDGSVRDTRAGGLPWETRDGFTPIKFR